MAVLTASQVFMRLRRVFQTMLALMVNATLCSNVVERVTAFCIGLLLSLLLTTLHKGASHP